MKGAWLPITWHRPTLGPCISVQGCASQTCSDRTLSFLQMKAGHSVAKWHKRGASHKMAAQVEPTKQVQKGSKRGKPLTLGNEGLPHCRNARSRPDVLGDCMLSSPPGIEAQDVGLTRNLILWTRMGGHQRFYTSWWFDCWFICNFLDNVDILLFFLQKENINK